MVSGKDFISYIIGTNRVDLYVGWTVFAAFQLLFNATAVRYFTFKQMYKNKYDMLLRINKIHSNLLNALHV